MGGIAKDAQQRQTPSGGLRVLWITPLRALARDIADALQRLSEGVGLGWEVELRLGDTSSSIKARQRKKLPEILVTTPESLHVMMSYPGSEVLLRDIQCVVIDEWHDLIVSKRGVMVQLALARLHSLSQDMKVWGISATIGNPTSAMSTLLAAQTRPTILIQDTRPKQIRLETVIPENIDNFPWAGHLGDSQIRQVRDIIMNNQSTLVFTNTRNQSETWYRKLLSAEPDLAGQLALHHSSLASDQRTWVEHALHEGKLKAVICTSSLDLGVDFRPVDTVIQIGSPKGVARLLQRAGRSGHGPGEISRAFFVPTHALELFEAAALKTAISHHDIESVKSPRMSLDVLVQWLVTLGAGDGLDVATVYEEIIHTSAYREMTQLQWNWAIAFVTSGGNALGNYSEYHKLQAGKDGRLHAVSRDVTTRHRIAIGTITSSAGLHVQVLRGQIVGSVDETFAGSLQPGQTFWLAGRSLEFVRVRDMTVWVRASKLRRGITPAWTGGRLPLSSQLASLLRSQVSDAQSGPYQSPELRALRPLLRIQSTWSSIPDLDQTLVEQFYDREGHHICIYPFEGRATHEVIAMLIATRIGADPNTFSFAFNDYGFEILAAKPIDLNIDRLHELCSPDNLAADMHRAIQQGSLPRREFRSIAIIAGLVTSGRPGKPQSNRHLQASSEVIYDVLREYDSDNQLLRQAYDEVMASVVAIDRLIQTLERIRKCRIIMTSPPRATPFAFPLIADRLRERLSTEALADRLARMQAGLERHATNG